MQDLIDLIDRSTTPMYKIYTLPNFSGSNVDLMILWLTMGFYELSINVYEYFNWLKPNDKALFIFIITGG